MQVVTDKLARYRMLHICCNVQLGSSPDTVVHAQ